MDMTDDEDVDDDDDSPFFIIEPQMDRKRCEIET